MNVYIIITSTSEIQNLSGKERKMKRKMGSKNGDILDVVQV